MIRLLHAFVLAFALSACASAPAAAQAQWDNVERIVAVGDLEGDYEKYLDILRTAGLIDAQGDWIGGSAHLVQLGDIPDRGPNSRAIMDHLMRIERQAQRAGGRVHALLGNHEAMNIEGDLRYVHPGEYAAFANRNSERVRTQAYRDTVARLRANPPETGMPAFDTAWRTQWESEYPLGYIEHRRAFAPTGPYGRWLIGHNAVIRINDTLFLHAGIGPSFNGLSRETMNSAIQAALRGNPVVGLENIVTNQEGPLWYRGLSLNNETTENGNLEAVLARHGVRRIVVGHTKLAPAIMPRFGGRVIVADVAMPAGHPDPHAFVVIEGGAISAVHRGQSVPIVVETPEQRCAYLSSIAALDPAGSPIAALATACATPAAAAAE